MMRAKNIIFKKVSFCGMIRTRQVILTELYGFYYPAGADALGADAHFARTAIRLNFYGLEIRQEAALGLAGNLSPYAAFPLGEAAALYLVSNRGSFTADLASSSH